MKNNLNGQWMGKCEGTNTGFVVLNVDESYIKAKETSGQTYLQAIDLPVSERRKAMRELGYMGITAGALFPGLDGACEEFRERNFDI
jgi:hypothetical protein